MQAGNNGAEIELCTTAAFLTSFSFDLFFTQLV